MTLLCFEFQITSWTKPRCCFTLFSKHYSKTFRTLPNFLAHKFSKYSMDISISKKRTNQKKNTTRKQWKLKTNFECFHPFSFLFPTVDNYDSSSSGTISLDDIKVILDNSITFVKRYIILLNKCKYNA